MKVKIYPSSLNGTLAVPSSKSHFQRVLAGALLCKGTSTIHYHSMSNDDKAALEIIQQLGAKVEIVDNLIKVTGGLVASPSSINCRESGLSLRMFTPILSLLTNKIVVSGEGSLMQRPQQFMEQAFSQLGVNFETSNGLLPINIHGPIRGGEIKLDGSYSSQFLTGLLMALSQSKEDSKLMVLNLVSKPYIELTLAVLDAFGIEIVHNQYEQFFIKGNQQYRAGKFVIEGDWSAAANLIVGGITSGVLTLLNLRSNSTQADYSLMKLLGQLNIDCSHTYDKLNIKKSSIRAFEFDATHSPDLFPPLVALAAHAAGTSSIKGAHRLEHKESNRAKALIAEYKKLGIYISIEGDSLIINGAQPSGGIVNSHNDHRIAMSLAITAISATDAIIIENAACVNKSYPAFWNDLKKLGVKIDSFD